MRFRSLLMAVRDELAANPTRSSLAAASVVVGITCLVVVVALTGLGEQAIRSEIERTAGRAATYQIDGLKSDDPKLVRTLTDAMDQRLDQLGISAHSRYDGYSATAPGETNAELFAIDRSYSRIRTTDVLQGRWLNSDDDHRYPISVAANGAAWDALPNSRPGAVTVLHVGGSRITARLVAHIDDGRSEATLYVSSTALHAAQVDLPTPQPGYLYAVTPSDATQLAQDIARIPQNLGAEGVSLHRVDDSDAFQRVFRIVQGFGVGAAALALAAGSLGFLNLGLASVQQRVRDFGVLRSFGATRRAIFVTVLLESVAITFAAGIAAVALSWIAMQAVPTVGGISFAHADLSVSAIITGLIVSVALGIAVGLIPARRATRVNVIEAIRTA
ncbi:hypothetical protein TU94_00190 [Streptomyces cyaneogriseus subsp. noncyanogenus]|uniref:ABC transporter permease n=1 Tax=Streptomyces cyaneogriseus subsp. noncyanogenus TaxID=477245 RepID=A0A0C5FKF0_9ACTN|nr:ABC transporter permease [Streptomyces cyaneogriseus]AJP00212.1 hypothetical protein TU94_00190 [Streptomyces cyaneogriseus subsp. noncyanogenus]